MNKYNATAVCIPSKQDMVDLSERIKAIKQLVDDGKHFSVNRARPYGKTATVTELWLALSDQYVVTSIVFQDVTDADFENESEWSIFKVNKAVNL